MCVSNRLLASLLSIALLASCSFTQESLPYNQRKHQLPIAHTEQLDLGERPGKQLKVITLNLAHGRGDSFNQMFVRDKTIRQNLLRIAKFLKEQDADIVALQEADDSSSWSGDFNHVAFIAEQAGYPWYVQSNHVVNTWANYGTAIISKVPIVESVRFDFEPTPPTTNKGFTMAQIRWKSSLADETVYLLDIVSIHLDFSRESKRISQIDQLGRFLDERNSMAIVLGDFNSEWVGDEEVVAALAEDGQFQVFDPESNELKTYSKKRLDWILIPASFEFINYWVSPKVLSDHFAVVAEIKLG